MSDLEKVNEICWNNYCVSADGTKCILFDIEINECMITGDNPRDWDIDKIKKILEGEK